MVCGCCKNWIKRRLSYILRRLIKMRPQYEQITWWTVLWCWNILLLSLINYFILLPDPLPPLCTPPSGPPRRSSYTIIRKKKNENNRRRRLDKFKKQMTGKHHPSSHSFATYYIGREGRNKKIKILLYTK